ncbi:peptide ligase PGM1-related protein [Streptomyces sp. CS62]|uniref:preATP grasp domain-containing protein n=1 Tax=Streptomyces sp. CS62 TaxID=3119268 RepID=UPI002F932052
MTGPLVHYANLVSDLAVDLAEGGALRAWAEQAPREVWLLRPGDVLVSPVEIGEEFLAYACALTGVPRASLAVVADPGAFGAAARPGPHPAAAAVRAAAGSRVPAAVLPTALDASAVALARELGTPVHPYATADDAEAALEVTRLLNTKAGFREAGRALGMRLPDGRVCRRGGVAAAVARMLRAHGEVVVKPDRSAGGHGMLFLSADAGPWTARGLAAVGGERGMWVVEERIDAVRSVSVQMETGPHGPRTLFTGEMRTVEGAFAGYAAPLPEGSAGLGAVLEEWGGALGRYLAERGYAGPFGLDAMVSADGVPYAGESNVRRTATTTPQAMAARLAAAAGYGERAWATGRVRAEPGLRFGSAVARLRAEGLAYDPARCEGVVLYAGAPARGAAWRYAVLAPDLAGALRYEALLHAAWAPAG